MVVVDSRVWRAAGRGRKPGREARNRGGARVCACVRACWGLAMARQPGGGAARAVPGASCCCVAMQPRLAGSLRWGGGGGGRRARAPWYTSRRACSLHAPPPPLLGAAARRQCSPRDAKPASAPVCTGLRAAAPPVSPSVPRRCRPGARPPRTAREGVTCSAPWWHATHDAWPGRGHACGLLWLCARPSPAGVPLGSPGAAGLRPAD